MPATSEWQRVGLLVILVALVVLLISTALGFIWIQVLRTLGFGSLWFMMIAGGFCVVMVFVQGFARVTAGTVVNGQKLRWISGDAVCFIRPWKDGKKEIGVWVSMLGPDGACAFQFRHSRRGRDRLRTLLSLWCADKRLSEPEPLRARESNRHSVCER